MTFNIGILVSGNGTNMDAILDHIERENADVKVVFVATDKENAPAIEKAHERGLTTALLPYVVDRRAAEAQLNRMWRDYRVDALVLAGFMKLLSPRFVNRHANRILNIHPALLPAFPGAHAIDDFWISDEKTSGVTVHIVDEKMDHGPIIAQREVTQEESDTLASFEEKIHAVEHELYWEALKKYIEDRKAAKAEKAAEKKEEKSA